MITSKAHKENAQGLLLMPCLHIYSGLYYEYSLRIQNHAVSVEKKGHHFPNIIL